MRRSLAVNPNCVRKSGVAVALGCLGALLWFAAACAHQTVKLTGNHPQIAAQPAGPIAPGRILTMAVVFKTRNPAELSQFLSEQQDPSSPNYHRWLTPQEFARRFGPDPDQVKAVRDWLAARGFEIVSWSPQQRSITFKGSADLAERVFKTRIVTYAGGAYANVDDPSIPARFAGIIAAISGLDNTARAVPANN
jgi:subtilase family serine protease